MGLLELTEEEINKLKEIHKHTRNNTIKENRIKTVLAYNNGETKEKIRDILLLDLKTIRRYINDFKQHRIKSIEDYYDKREDGNHRTKKLNETELQKLEKFVQDDLISDSKVIQEYIKDEFDVTYTTQGIRDILHELGFVYKKVTLAPQNANSEEQIKKQLEFEKNYETLTDSLNEEDTLYFFDAEHLTHNTKVAYAWIKKGKTKEIEANSGRSRLNIVGAYSPITAQALVNFENTVNATSVINMFDKLLEENRDKSGNIYIILDNAGYNKAKTVQEALTQPKYERIKLIFLPTYSPNLNLIERLWKFTNINIRNNKFYEKFSDFKNSFKKFFNKTLTTEQMKEKLRQFISDKFHIPNRDLVEFNPKLAQGFVFNKFE